MIGIRHPLIMTNTMTLILPPVLSAKHIPLEVVIGSFRGADPEILAAQVNEEAEGFFL